MTNGPIIFHCECGQKLNAPASFAGRSFKCPKCSTSLVVPQVEIDASRIFEDSEPIPEIPQTPQKKRRLVTTEYDLNQKARSYSELVGLFVRVAGWLGGTLCFAVFFVAMTTAPNDQTRIFATAIFFGNLIILAVSCCTILMATSLVQMVADIHKKLVVEQQQNESST